MQQDWFNDMDKNRIDSGLDFDKKLLLKYPDITASLAENNSNMCSVFFMDFEEGDEEMRPISMSCGHQFSAVAWTEYLKTEVRTNGEGCVRATCQ